jgi:hypothetical protein
MRLSAGISRLVLLTALGCHGSTEPYVLSQVRVPGLEVAVSASPSTATLGEDVRLTVTAHNSTDQRIQIGVLCGPAMDAVITGPMGSRVSILAEMLGLDAAFTCELGPRHFADPGETETLQLTWRVRPVRGEYTVVAGLRREHGQLDNLSAPVRISVR